MVNFYCILIFHSGGIELRSLLLFMLYILGTPADSMTSMICTVPHTDPWWKFGLHVAEIGQFGMIA